MGEPLIRACLHLGQVEPVPARGPAARREIEYDDLLVLVGQRGHVGGEVRGGDELIDLVPERKRICFAASPHGQLASDQLRALIVLGKGEVERHYLPGNYVGAKAFSIRVLHDCLDAAAPVRGGLGKRGKKIDIRAGGSGEPRVGARLRRGKRGLKKTEYEGGNPETAGNTIHPG